MWDYVELIWGVIFTLILSMLLGYFLGALGSFAGFLVVAVFVGHRVDEDMVNGALHGLVVALLSGILSLMIMMSTWAILGIGPGSDLMDFGLIGLVLGLLIDVIVGASGGVLGASLNV